MMKAELSYPLSLSTLEYNMQQPPQCESPANHLTVRMLMQGKEVGSIIGKKGDNVKRYREESGSKINISDASCPERVVTVTGAVEQIQKAFEMICIKFEEDLQAQSSPGSTLPPVSVRLVIPASQCGSLIGKGGTKIKELRESTGASVQVASEMLPGSTERAVTVTGNSTSISRCIADVCNIMLESPPKGATIPYRPKPMLQAPMMYAGGQAYALPGQPLQMAPHMHPMAVNAGGATPNSQMSSEGQKIMHSSPVMSTAGIMPQAFSHQQLAQLAPQAPPFIIPPSAYGAYMQPGLAVAGMNAMNSFLAAAAVRPFNNGLFNPLSAQQQTQSTEMTIPNELIGCIIGRGGAKINEIRQLSGAQIKISNCEEGTSDRKVTVTGYPDTIAMATYLINTSLEIHKQQLLNSSDPNAMTAVSVSQPMTTMVQTAATAPTAPMLHKPASALMPYSLSMSPAYGLNMLPNPLSFGGAYDPKALLTSANKLKMLPSATSMKLDHRFAPY